jgi:hypothetical protein
MKLTVTQEPMRARPYRSEADFQRADVARMRAMNWHGVKIHTGDGAADYVFTHPNAPAIFVEYKFGYGALSAQQAGRLLDRVADWYVVYVRWPDVSISARPGPENVAGVSLTGVHRGVLQSLKTVAAVRLIRANSSAPTQQDLPV